MKSTLRRFAAFAVAGVIGCSGDGGSGPSGSISLSAAPTSLTLVQGTSGTVTVSLVRSGGFDDPVNVSVTGLPSGVTASVTPAQLNAATLQAQVTAAAAIDAAAGTYTVTVSAVGAGVASSTTASTTYSLTITPRPDFSLSANPNVVSIVQGASGTTDIQIARTNFIAPIGLALTGAPPGMTGQFSQNPANGQNSTLTISVAASVAAGTYQVSVVGAAAGVQDKTTAISIAVTPRPDFTLSVSSGTMSIQAGSTGQNTVSITRSNFTGSVSLALANPPAGITGAFGSSPTNGTSSSLTLSVGATVAPGQYVLTIAGTAAGLPDRTTTINLTVTAAPGFSLSFSSGSVTIVPGTFADIGITINRSSYDLPVQLDLQNPPAGFDGLFIPGYTTGTSSTLTLGVSQFAAEGTYTVTVVGVGQGLAPRTATITVIVAFPPEFSLSVSPQSAALFQGLSIQVKVKVVRSHFTGPVVLSLDSSQAVTAVFATIPANSDSALGTITVGSTATIGQRTLTIRGTAAGIQRTTTFALFISAGQPQPPPSDFTLSLNQPGITISPASLGQVIVNINRTNFTAAVDLVLDAPPPGITAGFNLASTTDITSVMTINVAPGTAAGVYTLTIKGTGSVGTRTTTLQLTVP